MAIVGPWSSRSSRAGRPRGPRRRDGTDGRSHDGRREYVPQPRLTAKLATTLDQVSDGRAVLGIGGAWFGREHDAYGIDFGAASASGSTGWTRPFHSCAGSSMANGSRSTSGRFYRMHDALVEPRPIQPRCRS